MRNPQPPPPPSNDGQPPMVRHCRSLFILSQVAKDKVGSSANVHTVPKEEVEAVTGAARIRKIANSVGTNTTQCTDIATTNADNNDDPMEIPADTEALNINGYHAENLVKESYFFHADFPQY